MISQVLRSPLRNDKHTGTWSCHRNWLQIVFLLSLCADMPRCLETVSDLDLTISSGHNIQYHMRCYSLLRVCARFEEELWALVRGNETVYTHIILNRSFEKTGVIDQSELIITCFLFCDDRLICRLNETLAGNKSCSAYGTSKALIDIFL